MSLRFDLDVDTTRNLRDPLGLESLWVNRNLEKNGGFETLWVILPTASKPTRFHDMSLRVNLVLLQLTHR